MSKELIVSVNGREKKIAIIENGRVTEFYIERGESSQGIVGNIYKGRVMRVLPGMQSAFVDIGLERDAFLYVSDFFDEEEEFERIVIDKSKGEGADPAAARAAAERIEQARLERERQMESAQELAEPLLEAGAAADLGDEAAESDAPLAEAREKSPVRGHAGAEEPEAGEQRRGRRGQRREKGPTAASEGTTPPPHTRGARSAAVTTFDERRDAEDAPYISREDIAGTPFSAGAPSFQRVVDEDETAADEGEMFKDARLQERLLDQIRGVEFDMEATSPAQVGSLFSPGSSADSSFQRIDDSDVASGDVQTASYPAPQTVAASVTEFSDEFTGQGVDERGYPVQSFERVSDDEREVEGGTSSAGAAKTAAEAPASGARRKRGGGGGQRAAQTARREAPTSAPAALRGAATKQQESEEETPKKKRPATSRSRPATTTAGATKKPAGARSESAGTATKRRTRRPRQAADEATGGDPAAATAASGEEATGQEVTGSAGEQFDDTEASITGQRGRGEFARRGGRRRRRPVGKSATDGGNDEERADGDEAEVPSDIEEPVAVTPEVLPAPVAVAAKGRAPRRSEDNREPRSGNGRRSRGGDDGHSGAGSGGGGGRERRERQQPVITDLLREGQEIIVQIAKEPISQKGARITSHIALPGRYLVYMPTIEHVGVSRKIESDSERVRLRKLIQAINKEEDVPSGGFIVRTAGVGMSEADLRDDARYLVRTWRDIRRTAEKAKAPALVHRDLDLVLRILRDQLSDDFTAIRVDSEEEYLSIVEFINRIQPRLVKRVKLYTREEPILEAYAVQAEIEKAIKPRVWLRSGGYLVINQTEALVAIDVNTGKFVGRGGSRLEDTITRTNMEAVDEIARQIRLRDLGGIIVLDLIDMEERRNRQRVMQALQEALRDDKSPTKVLSFNDFGLVIMTRKRVKQSLERTLCSPCPYCQGSSMVKSPQTVCYEILEEARRLARGLDGEIVKQTTLRLNPEVARALRSSESDVLAEIEDYLGAVDITSDEHVHQEQFDFAFI